MVCIFLLQFFPASISLGVSWLSYFSDIFGGGTFCGLIMGSIVWFAVSIDPLRLFWLINWNEFALEVSFAFDVLGFPGVGLKSTILLGWEDISSFGLGIWWNFLFLIFNTFVITLLYVGMAHKWQCIQRIVNGLIPYLLLLSEKWIMTKSTICSAVPVYIS